MAVTLLLGLWPLVYLYQGPSPRDKTAQDLYVGSKSNDRECSKSASVEWEEIVEAKDAIPHAKALQDAYLCRSLAHQRKFFSVRDSVLSWIENHEEQKHLLKGSGKQGRMFAFIINKEYAFRHILKSGGTTVQHQTRKGQHGHVPQWQVGNRSLLATVRDPVDHFLSGWAECGYRNFDSMMNLTKSKKYDDRVKAWLDHIHKRKGNGRKGSQHLKMCEPHSMPQANYLWQSDNKFEWDTKLVIVGHLTEISGLLKIVGFHYNASISIGNDAKENEIKMQYFPRDKSLLSNSTIQEICRYVALDYYLFDFDPPLPCREELMANIAEMNITLPGKTRVKPYPVYR